MNKITREFLIENKVEESFLKWFDETFKYIDINNLKELNTNESLMLENMHKLISICKISFKINNDTYKYNDRGFLVYHKDSSNYEYLKEYDNFGNITNFKIKSSDGIILHEEWREYNNQGLEIYHKINNGFEEWREYNNQGLEIHYKNNNDCEHWREYNDKGLMVHYKDNKNSEQWNEYNDQGLLIHSKNSDKNEYWNEYSSNNLLIYCKFNDRIKKYQYKFIFEDGKVLEIK